MTKLFKECLDEAKGLIKTKERNEFIPALDDLVNQDIESVISKVQHELDLANEGEITTHYQTKRKAQSFIEKWEGVLEEEENDTAKAEEIINMSKDDFLSLNEVYISDYANLLIYNDNVVFKAVEIDIDRAYKALEEEGTYSVWGSDYGLELSTELQNLVAQAYKER